MHDGENNRPEVGLLKSKRYLKKDSALDNAPMKIWNSNHNNNKAMNDIYGMEHLDTYRNQ
jgi:hypothetical protein